MDITTEDLVSAFKSSGKTQEVFCKDYGITVEKLRYQLYKKVKRSTKEKSLCRKTQPAHSFISFTNSPRTNRAASDSKHSLTIIHGQFTFSEMTELILTLGGHQC